MDSWLGTSPQSVAGQHFRGTEFHEKDQIAETASISLSEFIELLPGVIEESRRLVGKGAVTYGSEDDPITKLYQ